MGENDPNEQSDGGTDRSVEASLSILRGYSREFSEQDYTDQLRILDEMHELLDDIEEEVSADV